MAKFYSLEEAARVLGMSPEELQHKAQTREVRAFMDSGSWQFKEFDVDELARRRGMGSDPDLSLSDLDLQIPSPGFVSGSEELMLSEFQLGVVRPDPGGSSGQELKAEGYGSGEQDVLMDESALPPNPMGNSSSVILGMGPKGKVPSDSDVRLVPDSPRSSSDSDVRLGPKAGPSDSDVSLLGGFRPERIGVRPSDSDVTLVSEERGRFDDSSEVIPATKKPAPGRHEPAPMIGSSGEVPAGHMDDDESDFELTPSSVIDALQPESGSDFELRALDASDEFDATPMRGPSDSDVTGAEPGASGINLGRPSDSGINLQSVGGFNLDSDSIELAPLDDDSGFAPPAPKKPATKKADLSATALPSKADLSATALPTKKADLSATALPTKKADLSATALPIKGKKPDLSATALPIKAKGEKDIFEDTDFEVDAVDSSGADDRTVQLEAASDFDMDDSESESQVFALDEDDVDQNASTALGPAVGDSEEFSDESEGISGETEADDAWSEVDDVATPSTAAARSVGASPALLASAPQAEWGGLWVGMLAVSAIFMLLLAFVGMDLITNMYDLRGDLPVSSGLVKTLAGLVGS